MYKLDVGCGLKKKEDFIGIDKKPLEGVDVVLNLDTEDVRLPYEDNSVEYIYCNHVLEHITNLIPLMNEFYRVLSTGSTLEINVPIVGAETNQGFIMGEGAFRDPTHVKFFTRDSFLYFEKGYMGNADYGIETNFKQTFVEIKISSAPAGTAEVNLYSRYRTIKE